MSDPDDLVTDATRAEEEQEASERPRADRAPTPEEEAAAEGHGDLNPEVAETYDEAQKRGANVKGEGQI